MHVLLTEIGLPCCLCNQAKILSDVIVQVAVKAEWTWDDAHEVGRESSSACAFVPKTAQGLKYQKITI